MRRKLVIVCGGLAALAVAATVVHAGGGNPQQPQVGTEVDAAHVFSQAWGASAPESSDPVVQELTQTAVSLGQDDGNVALSFHRLGTERVYTAIGTRVACLGTRSEDGSGSVGCAPTDSASRPDRPVMAVDVVGDGKYQVSGLVADGNDNVRVVLRDGSTARADVTDDVFSLRVSGAPDKVLWTGADAAEHTQQLSS